MFHRPGQVKAACEQAVVALQDVAWIRKCSTSLNRCCMGQELFHKPEQVKTACKQAVVASQDVAGVRNPSAGPN
eukprot:1140286-Pelagomonas_calceolata.AAC.1